MILFGAGKTVVLFYRLWLAAVLISWHIPTNNHFTSGCDVQASLKEEEGGKKKKKQSQKKKKERERKKSSPPACSSQEMQPQQTAYAKALWWLCRDQRTLGAQTAGPVSPRIMESLLIFLIYSVITDMCRQCVCVCWWWTWRQRNSKFSCRAQTFTPFWSWFDLKLSICKFKKKRQKMQYLQKTDRCTFNLSDTLTVLCLDNTFDLWAGYLHENVGGSE